MCDRCLLGTCLFIGAQNNFIIIINDQYVSIFIPHTHPPKIVYLFTVFDTLFDILLYMLTCKWIVRCPNLALLVSSYCQNMACLQDLRPAKSQTSLHFYVNYAETI